MGKIYYVMGKSASGKDTMYKKLIAECPKMKKIVLYTTRPMRDGETNGVEYNFTTEEGLAELEKEGKLIEKRTYQTMYGPWTYATVDDGQVNLARRNYVAIGTLESYEKIKAYYGEEYVRPIFLELDPAIRLQRALNRELQQKNPGYAEMCRRFLADEEDFSEDKLYYAGVTKRYVNESLTKCFEAIMRDIQEDGRTK